MRYCSFVFNEYAINQEAMDVTMLLTLILKKAGWSESWFGPEDCSGSGVSVNVSTQALSKTRKAATRLVEVLKQDQIEVVGAKVFTQRPSTAEISNFPEHLRQPAVPVDAVVISVAGH